MIYFNPIKLPLSPLLKVHLRNSVGKRVSPLELHNQDGRDNIDHKLFWLFKTVKL